MLSFLLSVIATFILIILGWDPQMPEYPYKKAVLIYPHSSRWDNILNFLYIIANERYNTYFLTKRLFNDSYDSWINFNVFTCDAESRIKENLTDKLADFIKKNESVILFISPKGNMSMDTWKTGYKIIAEKANVPVIVGGLDFREKRFKFVDNIKDITPLYPRENFLDSTTPDQTPINYFYIIIIIIIFLFLKWRML